MATCSTCSACWGPDLPHCRGGLTLFGPSTSRDWRRLRPASRREAVVEAPDPPSADHGLSGTSTSQHQAALAAIVYNAATQQAVQSSREWLPEDFELEAGEVSAVHRAGLDSPADVFHCSGCSLPECQVRGPTCCTVGSTATLRVVSFAQGVCASSLCSLWRMPRPWVTGAVSSATDLSSASCCCCAYSEVLPSEHSKRWPYLQGSEGCATMQWRFEDGGYLREILMSRVYDVAIETPLEPAARLSEALGNTVHDPLRSCAEAVKKVMFDHGSVAPLTPARTLPLMLTSMHPDAQLGPRQQPLPTLINMCANVYI